jgi:hypothetical protein
VYYVDKWFSFVNSAADVGVLEYNLKIFKGVAQKGAQGNIKLLSYVRYKNNLEKVFFWSHSSRSC